MSELNGQSDKNKGLIRLRQQKSEFENGDRESGREDGRKWALGSADYSDLVALKNANIGEEATANAIAETIDGDVPGVFGPRHEEQSPRYYGGWVAGALEILKEADEPVYAGPIARGFTG